MLIGVVAKPALLMTLCAAGTQPLCSLCIYYASVFTLITLKFLYVRVYFQFAVYANVFWVNVCSLKKDTASHLKLTCRIKFSPKVPELDTGRAGCTSLFL